MENEELPKTIETRGPRMLPRVTLSNKKTYFIDERLNQMRNIYDPFDFIDDYMSFLEAEDRDKVKMCEHKFTNFITISCGKCGKKLFNGTDIQAKRRIIYCTDCATK